MDEKGGRFEMAVRGFLDATYMHVEIQLLQAWLHAKIAYKGSS